MQHLVAYYQSVNNGGVLTKINAVPDQAIFTSGADVRIPPDIVNIICEAALINDASASQAQLQSPSLRDLANRDIEPLVAAAVFPNNTPLQYHGASPIALDANESMNFYAKAAPAGAISNYGLVWLADGAVKPVNGEMFTIAASGVAALVAGQWVNTPITFDQNLPAGQYQVVGFRARSANLVAARIVFIGQGYRPGVPGSSTIASFDHGLFRYGNAGVFGQFDINQPPSVDCLGITDVAQTFLFDLIKVK